MEKFVYRREGWSHMLAVTILASSMASSIESTTTIRTVLFIMVLVAVALLLAGGVIALMTLYKQLKRDEAR